MLWYIQTLRRLGQRFPEQLHFSWPSMSKSKSKSECGDVGGVEEQRTAAEKRKRKKRKEAAAEGAGRQDGWDGRQEKAGKQWADTVFDGSDCCGN